MLNRFSTILLLMIFSASTNAALVTIDFQDADPSMIRNSQDSDACIANVSVNHDGFNFSNPGSCSAYGEFLDNGALNIGLYYASGPGENEVSMTMSRIDGTAFDLLDLDLVLGASRWTYIYGYRDGQEVYGEYYQINGFRENRELNWLDLDKVVFYKDSRAPNSFGIDNLSVNVVPIPAAAWLFGSALMGLGWVRRHAA